MLSWIELEAREYIDRIDETGDLTDDLINSLTEAIKAYKTIYKFSFGK